MSAGTNIRVIAGATLREAMRGKQLMAVGFAASALLLVAMVFGLVTLGEQGRVVKDFGLFAASIAVAGYASIAGSSFLEKELSRKTAYNILSKPVGRSHFIIGKWLGLVSACSILMASLITVTAALSTIITGTFDPILLMALCYGALELILTCSCAIFFSAIVVTPVLAGIFTAALFLTGRSAHYFLYFVDRGVTHEPVTTLLKICYWALPNLAEINVANDLVFGTVPPIQHLVMSVVYVGSYSCLLLLVSCILFERRSFL